MDLPESSSSSFIVKVWLEEAAAEDGRAVWRGHITHVPSGRRRYLRDLAGIVAFIAPYLEELGVQFDDRWWAVSDGMPGRAGRDAGA